jgi:hypothetical protein
MHLLNPPLSAGLVFACLFGASLLGMRLRSRLPHHHLSSETKEAVRIGMASTTTIAALSVAGARFLILELDHSFSGLLRISPAPMLNALTQLAK